MNKPTVVKFFDYTCCLEKSKLHCILCSEFISAKKMSYFVFKHLIICKGSKSRVKRSKTQFILSLITNYPTQFNSWYNHKSNCSSSEKEYISNKVLIGGTIQSASQFWTEVDKIMFLYGRRKTIKNAGYPRKTQAEIQLVQTIIELYKQLPFDLKCDVNILTRIDTSDTTSSRAKRSIADSDATSDNDDDIAFLRTQNQKLQDQLIATCQENEILRRTGVVRTTLESDLMVSSFEFDQLRVENEELRLEVSRLKRS
jgi:hypothetical protein